MPMIEKARKTTVKRISTPPYGDIKIRVIDEITFVDPRDQYREVRFFFKNEDIHSRDQADWDSKARKVDIFGIGARQEDWPADLHPIVIQFEVIRKMTVIDKRSNGQKFRYTFGESTPRIKHKAVNFVTRCSDRQNGQFYGTSIALQRVEKMLLRDPRENGQESMFHLKWTDDDVTGAGDTVESFSNYPLRLDPFQQIIGANLSFKFLTDTATATLTPERDQIKYYPHFSTDQNMFIIGPGGKTIDVAKGQKLQPSGFILHCDTFYKRTAIEEETETWERL